MFEDEVQAVGVQGEGWRGVCHARESLLAHNLLSLAHQFILFVLQVEGMN